MKTLTRPTHPMSIHFLISLFPRFLPFSSTSSPPPLLNKFLTRHFLRLPFGWHLTTTGSWRVHFLYINNFLLNGLSTLLSTAKCSYWCVCDKKRFILYILNTTSNYIWTSYIVFQLNYAEWHINVSVISDTNFSSYLPYTIRFRTCDATLNYPILDSVL